LVVTAIYIVIMFEKIFALFQKLRLINQNKVQSNVVEPIKPSSVVILVPVSNSIEPSVDTALRQLEQRGYTVWRKYGFSAIDQGRCVLAQQALDAGFEHLFWIDADVCFWQYDIDKVIQSGLPFVSAPYSVKGWPALTTEFVDKNVILGDAGKLYEVIFAATGFMYTHRSVYQKIIDKFNMQRVKIWGGQYEVYPFFLPLLVDGYYLGEDFAFCHRLRDAGIKLYCDTRIQLSHIGKYSYSFAFLDNDGHPNEPTSVVYKQSSNRSY